MEQAREEAHQQQNQQQTPLKCPRCGSLDTRFRYFNNYSLSQPRRHCRTCRRQWTVGGKLRLIPIGGNTRNGKQTKASSSKGSDSSPQPIQPPLSLGEGHKQQLTLTTAKVSQNFNRTLLQPMTNMPEFIWAPQQAIFQQNSVTYEPYQTHTEATSAPPSHLYNSGVQPDWPMNFLLQDIGYDSSFTIPNACLQNNLSCDTTDAEDTTYVNVDEWLNLQGV